MFFLLTRRGGRAAVGCVFLKHLHTAIAGDAVTEVDDEVALRQIEKAVDRARFQPTTGHGRRSGVERRIALK